MKIKIICKECNSNINEVGYITINPVYSYYQIDKDTNNLIKNEKYNLDPLVAQRILKFHHHCPNCGFELDAKELIKMHLASK